MQAKNAATIEKEKISPGSKVTLHYRLSLCDGTIIDSTFDRRPLTFVMGDGTFPSGVEPMLFGMQGGDKNIRTLSPEQGWGYPDPGNVQFLTTSDFPDGEMLDPGKVIEFRLPNGESLPGTVLAIQGDRVQVDFNPPLAGRDITIEVDIISVKSAEVAK